PRPRRASPRLVSRPSWLRSHQLIPAPPEDAQVVLVAVELLALLAHATRHLRPAVLGPVGEPLLHQLERLDVVGRGEAAGTVEGEEGVEPARAGALPLLHRAERPGGDVHLAGTLGI